MAFLEQASLALLCPAAAVKHLCRPNQRPRTLASDPAPRGKLPLVPIYFIRSYTGLCTLVCSRIPAHRDWSVQDVALRAGSCSPCEPHPQTLQGYGSPLLRELPSCELALVSYCFVSPDWLILPQHVPACLGSGEIATVFCAICK